MKVEVSRSGGFAGMTRTWAVRVEETPDPQSFLLLVAACPWDDPESLVPTASPTQADRYVYDLQAGSQVASLPETAVQGPWRDLIDTVRKFSPGHGLGPSQQSGPSSGSGPSTENGPAPQSAPSQQTSPSSESGLGLL